MQREGVANVVNWLIISIHASQHRMRRHHSRHDHFPFIISIHAPIVGCDYNRTVIVYFYFIFQSTHPSWGATLTVVVLQESQYNFNPRTHRGVRQSITTRHYVSQLFQSTHPSWGATYQSKIDCYVITDFNPRTHRGVRH